MSGGFQTEHGWMSNEEIAEYHGRFIYDRNHRRVLQFPYTVTHGVPQYRDIPDHVVDEHERNLEEWAAREESS
jgi:hypothetical protein